MNTTKDKQRVFITGGAGFIGANLVRYLLDRGEFDITVYDNLSEGSAENLDRAVTDSKKLGSAELIEGDILDFDRLSEALTGHDSVIHLAAYTKVRESIENPKEGLIANSTGTCNVLEAARIHNIERFIFASSNAAVGEQIPPINEQMISRPLSPYGAAKLYGESLCSVFFHCYGLKTAAFRFANAYGPYSSHKTSVVSKFIKRTSNDQCLEIYGDGKQTRDFIHAQDIAQAIHLIITHEESAGNNLWGEIFQIATGRETSIIDLATIISGLLNSTQQQLTFGPQVEGEIRQNYSDITKAKEYFGFHPEISLNVGLNKMCRE